MCFKIHLKASISQSLGSEVEGNPQKEEHGKCVCVCGGGDSSIEASNACSAETGHNRWLVRAGTCIKC